MAINLKKGQTINLEKEVYDLSSVTVGLGWDVKEKGFFESLLGNGSQEEEFDLDAIAFLLNAEGKVANIGDRRVGGTSSSTTTSGIPPATSSTRGTTARGTARGMTSRSSCA